MQQNWALARAHARTHARKYWIVSDRMQSKKCLPFLSVASSLAVQACLGVILSSFLFLIISCIFLSLANAHLAYKRHNVQIHFSLSLGRSVCECVHNIVMPTCLIYCCTPYYTKNGEHSPYHITIINTCYERWALRTFARSVLISLSSETLFIVWFGSSLFHWLQTCMNVICALSRPFHIHVVRVS